MKTLSLALFILSLSMVLYASETPERKDKFFEKKVAATYTRQIDAAKNRGDIIVSPEGPRDGGDFGKYTPDTKTSGLQEAFDTAKKTGRDMYIVGGNWSVGYVSAVVYILEETLRIPWMQNFRLDSGTNVIWYPQKEGDAIVMDSQMSCFYRFGILKSDAGGATLRIKPTTAGPDRFSVVTSLELYVSAIVGGGGAWPGGEHFKSELDPTHKWIGAGLMLDGSEGSIDGNRFSLIEVVGGNIGVLLGSKCTNNWIEANNIHLCSTALQVGQEGDNSVLYNHIRAYMDSQGIAGAVGARVFGTDNYLELSAGRTSPGNDLIFEKDAMNNLVTATRLLNGITNNSLASNNRVIMTSPVGKTIETPPLPQSGVEIKNTFCWPVIVSITDPGSVSQWSIGDVDGVVRVYKAGLSAGQDFILNSGERIRFDYTQKPDWNWRILK